MKKQFKVLSLISALFLGLFVTGCSNSSTLPKLTTVGTPTSGTTTTSNRVIQLPDLTGKTTQEVKDCLDEIDGLNYVLKIKSDILYSGDNAYEYDKFYGYAGSSNVAGADFSLTKKLTVYVTAANLPTSLEELAMSDEEFKEAYKVVTLNGKNYEGQSFIETGCGEVTVVGYVDGDTTRFKDQNGTVISLRYLGVDTPESTASFEPWGKAASNFTKTTLENAKKVVLESDYDLRTGMHEAGQQDSNGRYLGYVWYMDQNNEWHLLQLEQVLNCYTKDKVDTNSAYCKAITTIGSIVMKTGRRVWGEMDPNYDYSTTPTYLTIEQLRNNFSDYYGRRVKIRGVIACLDGLAPTIVDPITGYGIYYYVPSWSNASDKYMLEVGNEVVIDGVCTYYGVGEDSTDESLDVDDALELGSPQMSNFQQGCISKLSSNNVVTPKQIEFTELAPKWIGAYVEFTNLKVTKVYTSQAKNVTITCEDENGNKIDLYVADGNRYLAGSNENGVNVSEIKKDVIIDKVVGTLSYYAGYQVTVIDSSHIQYHK